MKKVLMMLVVAILSVTCFAFTGCSKIEGTYKFKSMSGKMDGMEISLEVGEKFMGMITLTEDYLTLTLNEDGTCIMTSAEDADSANKGTWVKDGDVIKVTASGETNEFKIDGKNLVLSVEESGEKLEIVLSK